MRKHRFHVVTMHPQLHVLAHILYYYRPVPRYPHDRLQHLPWMKSDKAEHGNQRLMHVHMASLPAHRPGLWERS